MISFVATAILSAAVIRLSLDGFLGLIFEFWNLVLLMTVFMFGMAYDRVHFIEHKEDDE